MPRSGGWTGIGFMTPFGGAGGVIIGGIFSFLPVLGVWMLPLGILLIAVDVAYVRRWVVHLWPKIEARWRLRSRRKRLR
jgi:hypothetical protein